MLESGVGRRRARQRGGHKSGRTGAREPSGVRVGRTPVGKGVFARRPYPEHAIIGEIQGDWIADPHYGSDYCLDIENGHQLEPHAPFRFVNHSCDPNCEFDLFDVPGDDDPEVRRRVFLIALRDIKAREELTIDYNWPAESAIPCRCRSDACRGWIVCYDQLGQLPPGAPATPQG